MRIKNIMEAIKETKYIPEKYILKLSTLKCHKKLNDIYVSSKNTLIIKFKDYCDTQTDIDTGITSSNIVSLMDIVFKSKPKSNSKFIFMSKDIFIIVTPGVINLIQEQVETIITDTDYIEMPYPTTIVLTDVGIMTKTCGLVRVISTTGESFSISTNYDEDLDRASVRVVYDEYSFNSKLENYREYFSAPITKDINSSILISLMQNIKLEKNLNFNHI